MPLAENQWVLTLGWSCNKRTESMQTIHAGYRSMSLLVSINWDRMLYVFTIVFALFLGAYLGSFAQ